ncbi:type VII secretion protein EssB/YukC, partial [Bacillus altitudinis]|uniref:type VII secretion protein EssB/YukC n=1 Tax=Bacillus altitudinis TaxID=293387 RepID=UPI003B5263D6
MHPKHQKTKSIFSYHLLHPVSKHHLNRLHPILSPQNILFHQALPPPFFHYPLKQTIPPYQTDQHPLLKHLKPLILPLLHHQ